MPLGGRDNGRGRRYHAPWFRWRNRDMKLYTRDIPDGDELPESCKATSKFYETSNPLWYALKLTNIQPLDEQCREAS